MKLQIHQSTASLVPLLFLACAPDKETAPPSAPPGAIVIEDSVTCASCDIAVDTLVTVGGSDSAPFFASTRLTMLAGAGFVAAAPLVDQGVVAIFDERGQLLRRLLRDGDGPAEMRRIRFAVGQEDTTLLLVGADGRARRVDLATLQVSSHSLPSGLLLYELVGGPGGRLLASAVSPEYPNVAVLSSDLRIEEAFGEQLVPSGSESTLAHPMALESRLGSRSDGIVAQARRKLSADVAIWTMDGTLQRRFRRQASWFPAYTPSEYQDESAFLPSQVRVKPQIVAVWPDTGSLVWLVGRIPDRNWRQADPLDAEPRVSARGVPALPDHDWSDFLDTVIEVIDWDSGRVIARSIMDTYAYRMAGVGILEVPGVSSDGTETRTLIKPRLVATSY